MMCIYTVYCICIYLCVCVNLTLNGAVFISGHAKWCVTLVTAGYDGTFSLWVTEPTHQSHSLFFFLFFALQVDACLCVCVCDMHHVFVSLHLCRCLFACVGGGVKKWACQKWMIRLIRWNIPDSKIKHSRERKSSNKVRIKVHLECVCASSAMFSHKIFLNVFLHYHAMGVWKKNPFPTLLCAKPSQVSI